MTWLAGGYTSISDPTVSENQHSRIAYTDVIPLPNKDYQAVIVREDSSAGSSFVYLLKRYGITPHLIDQAVCPIDPVVTWIPLNDGALLFDPSGWVCRIYRVGESIRFGSPYRLQGNGEDDPNRGWDDMSIAWISNTRFAVIHGDVWDTGIGSSGWLEIWITEYSIDSAYNISVARSPQLVWTTAWGQPAYYGDEWPEGVTTNNGNQGLLPIGWGVDHGNNYLSFVVIHADLYGSSTNRAGGAFVVRREGDGSYTTAYFFKHMGISPNPYSYTSIDYADGEMSRLNEGWCVSWSSSYSPAGGYPEDSRTWKYEGGGVFTEYRDGEIWPIVADGPRDLRVTSGAPGVGRFGLAELRPLGGTPSKWQMRAREAEGSPDTGTVYNANPIIEEVDLPTDDTFTHIPSNSYPADNHEYVAAGLGSVHDKIILLTYGTKNEGGVYEGKRYFCYAYNREVNIPELVIPRKGWAYEHGPRLERILREEGLPEDVIEDWLEAIKDWSDRRGYSDQDNYFTLEQWASALRAAENVE